MSLHLSPPSFSLNSKQQEAVSTLHGALLISAGAGSGKTQVLTTRIAHILEKKLADAGQILACTFTNKAAREMLERISMTLANTPVFEPLWVSTFHSTCARILRENISKLSPPRSQVVIYDTGDQLQLIKKIMKEQGINENFHTPKSFKQQISLCKQMALSPYDLDWQKRLKFTEDFPKFYELYEQALIAASAFDFEGLLFEVYQLFSKNPEVLSHYQDKFKFISIDEYQDTNHIQYLLVKQLADKHRNICVVGDEDQSIYSWRGADISNILNFEKDFPDCKVIKLEQNYRSTQTIVSAASSLIRHNFSRLNKKLFTQNHSGDLIQVQTEWNDVDEARFVAQTIAHLQEREGIDFQNFSVFYRTNAQSRLLEDQLRGRGIPYHIVGNLKFYDRAEVKDMICYLRLILNPNDELSLLRVINMPKRGIGKASIEKARNQAASNTLWESLLNLAHSNLFTSKTARAILEFHQTIELLRQQSLKISISNLYSQILEYTGYMEMLKMDNSIESKNKIENLNEFGNAIKQFEEEEKENPSLSTFLEQMSLLSSPANMPYESCVQMMTLHLSKGLEFDVVFITGWEEGLFPLVQNIEDTDVEEERRLAYVGMTRARKKLFLSYAKSRRRFGFEKKQIPSRFLKEIAQHHLNHSHKYPSHRYSLYE